ncbi:helix-turn-helix domain-containing protein [Actinomadura rupiterrae]|uniref:helix-turn-helix domain-containing protein n=1 Tax=Actinomadura rupiterrae TaxID=559627 RepID=UPI0020A2FDA1|nr:helix-turn-helix transcriptional regulator [Actinomadura rupiterrae]MCP2337609.1 transcriptional regulator with XRE-family HTH domain [Actinomadura rupiterrae]
MATDQGPVVDSALLRSELVRLRKEKGLTQEQVARTLEWSPSKLIRVEGGKSSITRTDLQALLMTYDVTSEGRQERLQSLARGARETPWWSRYRGLVSDELLSLTGYTAGASFIRQFHNALVPGLLQTREYAEVITSDLTSQTSQQMAIELRLERQRRLAERQEPPRQYYILDEAVIRRHVGVTVNPGLMPAQLREIADRAEREDLLTIRVVPFSAGYHQGVYGPFVLLEFDGGLSDVLQLEGRPGTAVTVSGGDAQVAEYRDIFENMLEEALSADASIELIRQVAAGMD